MVKVVTAWSCCLVRSKPQDNASSSFPVCPVKPGMAAGGFGAQWVLRMWKMVDIERPVKPETLGFLSLEASTPGPGNMLSNVQGSAHVGLVFVGYTGSHFSFSISLRR